MATKTTLYRGIDYRELPKQHWYSRRRYKYELIRPQEIRTGITVPKRIAGANTYLDLDIDGVLLVRFGYRWDGASGAIDSESTMRASLFHDALYQLMREGKLNRGEHRQKADMLLMRVMTDDGASLFRATLWLWGVHLFAGLAARGEVD